VAALLACTPGAGGQLYSGPIVESTGFEASDGWEVGFVCGEEFFDCAAPAGRLCPDPGGNCCVDDPNPDNGWHVAIDSQHCLEPHIDTANPFEGSQHLRLVRDPDVGWQADVSAASPYVGPQPAAPTTISLEAAATANHSWYDELRFSANAESDPVATTAITITMGGPIRVDGRWTGVYVARDGTYRNVTIALDPCSGVRRVYYAGDLIHEGSMAAHAARVERTEFATTGRYNRWDADNFSIVRGSPCVTTCGDGVLERGEQCEPALDAWCPGRCVPPGQPGECTCFIPSATCEGAQEIAPGTTDERSHGGWFTFVAETVAYAIDTCGAKDTEIRFWTGGCDNLELLGGNDDCTDEPTGVGADPFSVCYDSTVVSSRASCTCVATNPGQRYWVQEIKQTGSRNVSHIERITIEPLNSCGNWGACCDPASGGCEDNIAMDCRLEYKGWHRSEACDDIDCRTGGTAVIRFLWLEPQGLAADPYPPGTTGVGTRHLKLGAVPSPLQPLWLGMFISNWGRQGDLLGWQGSMNSSMLGTGLYVYRPDCTPDNDELCVDLVGPGSACNVGPIGGPCAPAFQQRERPAFERFELSGCHTATDDLSCFGAIGQSEPPHPDPGAERYGGTIVLAAGTPFAVDTPHTVDFHWPEGTGMVTERGERMLVSAESAAITIPLGSCCYNIGLASKAQCALQVTPAECEALNTGPFPPVFREGESCPTDGGPPCPSTSGACCDADAGPLAEDGRCENGSPYFACQCPSCFWFDGRSCGDVIASGACEADFVAIPAVSDWGLVVTALLLLIGAKVRFGRRWAASVP